MTCEHYWRDGILLVERGEQDPHRDTCVVCQRQHRVRDEIIRALPLVGSTTAGDLSWEARVWSRIARFEARPQRRWWHLSTGFVTAFAVVLACWTIFPREEVRPRIAVVSGNVAGPMRSTSPSVGDRVQITVKATDEVRVYRGDRLVLRCAVEFAGDGCLSRGRGMVAEVSLTISGAYRIVVIALGTTEPAGRLDLDLRAVVLADGEYQISELLVSDR